MAMTMSHITNALYTQDGSIGVSDNPIAGWISFKNSGHIPKTNKPFYGGNTI
jgi:hypothetical protein